jgi:hypothetical protein
VDHELERHVLAERSFWVAGGLAVLAGVGPLVAAMGQTNRLAGVVVPMLGAAGGCAALALTYRRGRTFSALIYLLTGLAIVYGLLLVLAIPMRLAVEGTCPPAPQRCTNGLEMQLSSPETLALSIAVGFGVLSLLAGFFGLLALYRLPPASGAQAPSVWPEKEPEGCRRAETKEEEKPAAEKAEPAEPPKADSPG